MKNFECIKSVAGLNVSFREDELTGKFNALYVNQKIVDSEKFTISRTHEFEYILYKDADEKIERDVPSVSEDILSHVNDNGIVKVGEYINDGDIIIGKISFSNEYKTPEERLLFSIFGERTGHDSSIYVPKNISGTVTDVLIETPKDNENLSSNIDKVITVVIRQDFPLQIGDILTDSNNGKGIVVGFFEPELLESTDIISNFYFDGTQITRISSVKCDMRARSVEPYSLVSGKPLGSCEFRIPQTITKSDIIKLTRAGMFSVVQDILLCYETKRRVEIYASIATPHKKAKYDTAISFNSRLRRFLYYIRLLGGKIIFKNSNNDELYNNDNWSFMQLCEKGFETLINQNVYFSIESEDESFQTYGEVTNPETINYRTTNPEVGGLFCEKIFGTTQNWKCRCGKYKNKRYQGVVCEKCGVVVESNDCRDYKFGHIKLENKYPNPIFPNSQISQVLMLPPNMRPFVKLGNERFASANINDAYRRILNRNIRIKRMEELGAPKLIFENEIKNLNSLMKALYKGSKRYKGVFSEFYDWIFQVLFECTVDYSAATRAIINTDLISGKCHIPYRVALELYEPILLNLMLEKNYVKNLKVAKRFINKAENKQVVIDVFNESACSYKMIALSSAEDGEPVILSAKIIDGYVTELNECDWKRLKLTTGDNVKLFLPITKYAQEVLTSPINLDDKLVNEFESFLNCFSTRKEVSAEEKRQYVLQAIHHIDGNKKFINSLLFCLLSGRRITDSERQRCKEEIRKVIDLGEEQEQILDDDKIDDDLEIKLKLFNLNDDADNDSDEDNQSDDLESVFSLFDDEDLFDDEGDD